MSTKISMCPLMKLIRVNSRQRSKNFVSRSQSGKLVKSESTSSDSPPHATNEKTTKNFFQSKHLKYMLISLFILIIIVVIAITTIISVKTEHTKSKPDDHKDVIDGEEDPNDTLIPAGPGLIIDKKTWRGRAATNETIPLKHPTPYVIISHTVTPQCVDFDSCSARVRSIQDYHMGTYKSPDIGYNFIIGGDGNAYVGRGWDIKNFHSSNSIGICFIGDYISDFLSSDMISIAQKLLEDGVKNAKLAQDYKLVGHNQTFATQSPGPHVYEIIKNWPHFYPGRLKLN